jgi:thiol-disulfide isomerase/thioredoxin
MLFSYNRHTNYTKRDCVHKISALLLTILFIGFTGCEEKTPEETSMAVKNTTEVVTQEGQKKVRVNTPVQERFFRQGIPPLEAGADTFTLNDTKGTSYKVTISNEKVIFHDNAKPIVLINLFATWCPPCVGQLAYLNDLQKKHDKDLFITGVLTHDSIDETLLKTFLAKNQLNYFISNSPHNDAFATLLASTVNLSENFPIPMTALYVEGKYFTHYEGVVPVEMIEYDIQQAKKTLK